MLNKAIKAVRNAACMTLVLCAPIALTGATPCIDAMPTHDVAVNEPSSNAVAGLLIPARTRLIIEYRRVALA